MSNLKSKYSATSIKTLKNKIDEENQNFGSSYSDFLTIDEGTNKFRICPKHPGEENFYQMRCIHWISVENDEGEMHRKTVLNSRIHGNGTRDIIEEYVAFAKKKLAFDDDADEKLSTLTHWQNGLLPNISWILYAFKIKKVGEKTVKEFGRLELKKSARDQMNSISITEDVDDPIEVDPFTDPEDGTPILITWSPKAKKASDKYKVVLAKNKMPLSEEELSILDKSKSLTEMYSGVYGIEDFELACEGLRNFDENYDMGCFDTDEFQETLEEVKAQYGEKSSKTNKSGDEFNSMDRERLKKYIKDSELNIVVKKSMTDDDIRKAIRSIMKVEEVEEVEDDVEEVEEVEEDDVEENEDGDEFNSMERTELKKYITSNGLEVVVKKSMTDDDIRNKIREAVAEDKTKEDIEEEEDEEEEDEEPKTKKPTLADIKKKLQSKK
ncbi:MAG TPA: hypothetical protein PKY56_00080 [Candidatus Kapabacteria bacterium]|nr:hypothetical protein [Candidatus Kapabacteria bacterium]